MAAAGRRRAPAGALSACRSPRAWGLRASDAAAACAPPDADCECPVCYQGLCEPVLAGCGRHAFCRNCLLKSPCVDGALFPRCPVCRAEGLVDASDAPEVAELVPRLRARDPRYSERVLLARRERQELLSRTDSGFFRSEGHDSFEVSGAGCLEANGVYLRGSLPSYVGPAVYRRGGSHLFLYRWRRRHWVIAELRSTGSMGDEHAWLYSAPARAPLDVPPLRGWQARRQGGHPAPELRLVRAGSRGVPRLPGAAALAARLRRWREEGGSLLGGQQGRRPPRGGPARAAVGGRDMQVKCGVVCNVM